MEEQANIDSKTVTDFRNEWNHFDQPHLTNEALKVISLVSVFFPCQKFIEVVPDIDCRSGLGKASCT